LIPRTETSYRQVTFRRTKVKPKWSKENYIEENIAKLKSSSPSSPQSVSCGPRGWGKLLIEYYILVTSFLKSVLIRKNIILLSDFMILHKNFIIQF
jgi:hypothetical protein